MDALDALQLRDQEINKALSLANDILNEDPKQDPDTQVTLSDSDDMDTLIGKQQIYFFLQKSQLLNSQIFYVEGCNFFTNKKLKIFTIASRFFFFSTPKIRNFLGLARQKREAKLFFYLSLIKFIFFDSSVRFVILATASFLVKF